jgi:hypothetical protein
MNPDVAMELESGPRPKPVKLWRIDETPLGRSLSHRPADEPPSCKWLMPTYSNPADIMIRTHSAATLAQYRWGLRVAIFCGSTEPRRTSARRFDERVDPRAHAKKPQANNYDARDQPLHSLEPQQTAAG